MSGTSSDRPDTREAAAAARGDRDGHDGRATWTWAAAIEPARCAAIGALRLVRGLECHAGAGRVWIRGPELDRSIDGVLRSIRGIERYRLDGEGRLFPADRGLVPCGRLPAGPWLPVETAISVDRTPPALPARVPERIPLRLVPSSRVEEPAALVTVMPAWARWVETAPAHRLARLAFAVSRRGRTLVRGTPLPPLPGRRFIEREGVAAPAGWTWSPAVDAEILRALAGAAGDDLLLLVAARRASGSNEPPEAGGGAEEDGGVAAHIIRGTHLVPATRSAVRLTAARWEAAMRRRRWERERGRGASPPEGTEGPGAPGP